jgi:hypothetical protein
MSRCWIDKRVSLSTTTGEIMRGRLFTQQDIKLIQRITKKRYEFGRTQISIDVCKALKWTQPNGYLKERACRDVLVALEKKGFLVLPPTRSRRKLSEDRIGKNYFIENIDKTLTSKIDFSSIKLSQVKGTNKEKIWNQLVDRYHYLGFRVFVGRSLKYLIYSNDRIIGAIGWCDPAWMITARDNLLKQIGINSMKAREMGINNGRFLILPWIKVPNLASYILSLAIKDIVHDWKDYYSVAPLYLETFVDPHKFLGTCYKAANWIQVGLSKGYKKVGQSHHNSQTPKILYLYPLDRSIKKQISKAMDNKK